MIKNPNPNDFTEYTAGYLAGISGKMRITGDILSDENAMRFIAESLQTHDFQKDWSTANDKSPPSSYDPAMTSPTREEIDAKLEAIEARMDARIATTLGKMEAFMAAADGREVVNQERFQKATADNSTNRSILVGGLLTIVVTVVSVYFALKADNQALINNLITATNTGAANGEFKATATNDIKKLQDDLAKKQDKK